ncbi:hypothetical protein VHEMI07915 [[Torrubiella] hemipterigena]|uniref:Large ribosomal subunit protein mL49 n=1 Tax=[Torrubiella] hemipterigena TaxID=1531966 RepID=A0A0A1TMK2_9HYPO|nr:hypothetical protein VHEMI07915 [[Torrubiella] hemipterigena]
MNSLLSRPLAAARQPAFLPLTTLRTIMVPNADRTTPFKMPPKDPRTFKPYAKTWPDPRRSRKLNANKPLFQPTERDPSKYLAHQRPATLHATASREELLSRAFMVNRTPWGQLAVYKTGRGTKVYTKIRKVEGDKKAFVNQISEDLAIKAGEISINPVTGNIHVKGVRVQEICNWLMDKGY